MDGLLYFRVPSGIRTHDLRNHNHEQFKQKYTNLCFNRYYGTPSKGAARHSGRALQHPRIHIRLLRLRYKSISNFLACALTDIIEHPLTYSLMAIVRNSKNNRRRNSGYRRRSVGKQRRAQCRGRLLPAERHQGIHQLNYGHHL